MDVVINVVWWIVVDHQGDVIDVNATCGHICRHQYRALATAEKIQCHLTFLLAPIPVHSHALVVALGI